jgi:hypothetical protein
MILLETTMSLRTDYFQAASLMMINGYPMYKLDFLSMVTIYGIPYFCIYRRYNSPYEIMIEDMQGDFHFQRNASIRTSLQSILCLTDEQMKTCTITEAISLKKNASIVLNPDASWSELQAMHQGAIINVEGILVDYPHSVAVPPVKEELCTDSDNTTMSYDSKKRNYESEEEEEEEDEEEQEEQEEQEDEEEEEDEEQEEQEEQEEEEEEEEEEECNEDTEEKKPHLIRSWLCLRNRRIRRLTVW